MSKNETYDMFVDKFVPKLTTDDCYTPEPVYNVVRDYVCRRLALILRLSSGRFIPAVTMKSLTISLTVSCWTIRRFRYWRKS